MTNFKSINDWRARINGNEHGVPHVHIQFRDGSRISLAIADGQLLAGHVSPVSRLVAVRAWIEANRDELTIEYSRINS